jgi:hypothetical protein
VLRGKKRVAVISYFNSLRYFPIHPPPISTPLYFVYKRTVTRTGTRPLGKRYITNVQGQQKEDLEGLNQPTLIEKCVGKVPKHKMGSSTLVFMQV